MKTVHKNRVLKNIISAGLNGEFECATTMSSCTISGEVKLNRRDRHKVMSGGQRGRQKVIPERDGDEVFMLEVKSEYYTS